MRALRIISCFFTVLLTVQSLCNGENTINIDSNNGTIFEVDPKFVSFTFDSSGLLDIEGYVLQKSILYKFKNEKLRKLVRHLSPAYFRVGGTMADTIRFYPRNDTEDDYPYADYSHPINETTLFDLTEATDSMGMDLIFDLAAALPRKADGSWDPRNAEKILKFCEENNLNVSGWELSNEPDCFIEGAGGIFPSILASTFNATQLGKDALVLRQMLDNTKKYKNSPMVGPDVLRIEYNGRGNPYLRDFLEVAGEKMDAITWHHYYFAGATATVDEFLNPSIFSSLPGKIQAGLDIVNGLNLGSKQKWLGETSSGYGGGSPNLSDRYPSTFIWLDKLGVSAKMGLSVVVRQTIIAGGYTLIDTDTDEENPIPNPDWWLTVLFKKVVGTKVLALNASTAATVRLYAHCATEDFGRGAVTVYGVNLENATATVSIQGLAGSNGKITVKAFELTSGSDSSLLTQDIKLNGNLLKVTSNYDLPELAGKVIDISQSSSLTMPAYSNVFWVITGAGIQACV